MGWKISPKVGAILGRAADLAGISRADALYLLNLDLDSKETYALMETANRLSRERFKGKGELHFLPLPASQPRKRKSDADVKKELKTSLLRAALRWALAALPALFIAAPLGLSAGEIRVGTWKTAQTIQPFFYEKFFPAAEKVEVFVFTNPADQKTALLAGSLDMCGTTLPHAIHSASRGQPVVVAGFLQPTSGEVLLKGKPVKGPGPERCVIFQEHAFFPWLTVQENIAFGLRGRALGKKSRAAEAERFLSLVGLNEFRNYLPREISGGMKQRVALARVLILKPEVLLMDEPFAALDAQSREEMQNLLLTLWQELAHTILFVTHDVREAVILADRILLMSKNPGKIREIRVDLPRPRSRESDSFLDFVRKLQAGLRNEGV